MSNYRRYRCESGRWVYPPLNVLLQIPEYLEAPLLFLLISNIAPCSLQRTDDVIAVIFCGTNYSRKKSHFTFTLAIETDFLFLVCSFNFTLLRINQLIVGRLNDFEESGTYGTFFRYNHSLDEWCNVAWMSHDKGKGHNMSSQFNRGPVRQLHSSSANRRGSVSLCFPVAYLQLREIRYSCGHKMQGDDFTRSSRTYIQH